MTAFAPLPTLTGESPSLLLGLIGSGIQASRTPRMHETEAAAHGLRCIYRLIDLDVLAHVPAKWPPVRGHEHAPIDKSGVDALPDLVTAAQRFGFAGLNITYPCKQAVIPLLDELSSDARALGAVNTVVFRAGTRIGHNTDWSGFAEGFRRDLNDARRERVVQFGAGGAGAAVSHALLTLGVAELTIIDTDASRAQRLADALCARFGDGSAVVGRDISAALAAAHGVVNTTPVGTAAHPGMAFPPALLRGDLWVADIVYFPLETELLREARSRGCRTMAGSGMAVFQAVDAFRLFTGREGDPARMRRAFESF